MSGEIHERKRQYFCNNGCRKLSAQIDKIGKNGIAYKYLEKVYSIWICLEGIQKRLQNTISYYKI